jgi:hypothetical protein
MTKITSSRHEDSCIFIVSDWVLLRVISLSDKFCRDRQNKLFHSKFWLQNFEWNNLIFNNVGRYNTSRAFYIQNK